MIAKIFIERPRFAIVISLVMSLAGGLAMISLPVTQYPEITPPQIVVETRYPGASSEVIAQTVGAPLEEEMNGVEDMLYMSSASDDTGTYELTITFAVGTDLDIAQVRVQNRVQRATPRLPAEVAQQGMSVSAQSSSMLGIIFFSSPGGTHDQFYISDYVHNNIKERLKRIEGVGSAQVFGPEYSMRVWLNTDRLTALGIGSDEVVGAIRSQNLQASVGAVGSAPGDDEMEMVYFLQAEGRLNNPEDFEDIIVRTNAEGGLTRLKDVARVEIGGNFYSSEAFGNGARGTGILLQQTPGTNALDAMDQVLADLKSMEFQFPEDVEYTVIYDATQYVRVSIQEIINTLLLTFFLVVLVCYIFLQDWRATLVPTISIPVSLFSTFAVLMAFGFSINLLTLFGLILAIGVVVDNAIIVVERVLFLMERDGSEPKEATAQAMREVTGAIIATTLVLLAIFVPVGFVAGIIGRIFQQFAVAISSAVIFSAIVALTLSPALCATLLRPIRPWRHGPLAWFNRVLNVSRDGYVETSRWLSLSKFVTVVALVLLFGATGALFFFTPGSFLPDEDQGIIFVSIQLPEGASMSRTRNLIQKTTPWALDTPGVGTIIGVAGFDLIGGRGENMGFMAVVLEPWDERRAEETQITGIIQNLRAKMSDVPEANINFFQPPPILGLGNASGLEIMLQARENPDSQQLGVVMNEFMGRLMAAREIMVAFGSYSADTPRLFLNLDRQKAQYLNIPVSRVFSTLQNYMGSRYVNDVNLGSQVNQVNIQADWPYRKSLEDARDLYVPNDQGGMAPIDSLVDMEIRKAPRQVRRFNLAPTAAITAMVPPVVSSGQGIALVEQLAEESLPEGYGLAWSGMSYQEKKTGSQGSALALMALVFGYLFLVAQYESWTIPIPVILSLVVAMLGALIGLSLTGLPLSIYAQLGLIMLVGIASKNAVLIVEFAKERREEGHGVVESAASAAGERFRPVLMTAFTFILGTLPLVFAVGAGAASRRAIGTTVFTGMTLATTLGIVIIPALYVLFQSFRERFSGGENTSTPSREETES